MSVPDIVEAELGDESVAARVSLSGGDEVFVTPTRSLVYRAEGLLSDESVESIPHDAERLSVSVGRRKATVTLDYQMDEPREFTVPKSRVEQVIEPLLAGVLRAGEVTEDDERIVDVFRFSELTLVITPDRLLKHLGSAVWSHEYDSHHFEDVTGLAYEEGDVATQVVLTVDGRKQRIKVPNDHVGKVRGQLESALFGYHDVDSAAELPPDDEDGDESEDGDGEDSVVEFDSGVDPLDAGGGADEAEPAAESEDTAEPAAEAASDAVVEGEEDGPDVAADADPADETVEADQEAGNEADTTSDDTAEGGETPEDEERSRADPEDQSDPADDGETATTAENEQTAIDDSDGESIETADDWDPGSVFDAGGVTPADDGPDDDLAAQLAAIRSAVERQNDLLERQQRAIEELTEAIEERD